MGCFYCNHEGKCDFFEKEEDSLKLGTNKKGFCVAEYDPFPADSCDSYETDNSYNNCPECGEDSENEEECEYCGYCFDCGCLECECEFE